VKTQIYPGGLMDSASIVFDRYRLEERIGAGGMGVVWKATDLQLDQPVALKRITLAGMDAEQAELTKARALREARTAARLRRHRHVVATYDVHLGSEDIWLVLEYLPSRTLGALCRERGRLEIVEVARIGAAVADALAAGHAQGIVHRDVTPANVLIAEDGTIKLTDFGISRVTGADQLTREGIISGTIAYLAPEVADRCEYTPASDVFSLGSTLYTAIEGQPPFGTDEDPLRLLNVIRTGIIRKPTSAGALTPLLARLLERDPTTRPDAATTDEAAGGGDCDGPGASDAASASHSPGTGNRPAGRARRDHGTGPSRCHHQLSLERPVRRRDRLRRRHHPVGYGLLPDHTGGRNRQTRSGARGRATPDSPGWARARRGDSRTVAPPHAETHRGAGSGAGTVTGAGGGETGLCAATGNPG